MSKHTPGPWHRIGALIRAPDGNRTIATVWGEGLARSQQEADAYLITAAPDLLAACEMLVRARDMSGGNLEDWEAQNMLDKATIAAELAVAKAKGETTDE